MNTDKSSILKAKNLSAKAIRDVLIKYGTSHAHSMKPHKILDHLKLKIGGFWYEIEPFYEYIDGKPVNFLIQLNPINDSVVPMELRGKFTLPQWNNYWRGREGQMARFEKAKKAQVGEVRTHQDGRTYMKISNNQWVPVKKNERGRWVVDKSGKGFSQSTGKTFTPTHTHVLTAENKLSKKSTGHKKIEETIAKQKSEGLHQQKITSGDLGIGHAVRVKPGTAKTKHEEQAEGMVGIIKNIKGRFAEIVNAVGKTFEVPLTALAIAKAHEVYFAMLKAGASGYPLQGRRKFCGMDISIENKAGSYRKWKEPNGNEGQTKMLIDYGYIKGTEGTDGDHVDVFLGPNEESDNVFVIHQLRPDNGKYDEDKVMLGFDDAATAKKMYLKHYDSIKFFGGMKKMSMDEFKEKVYKTLHGKKKTLKAKYIKRIPKPGGGFRYIYVKPKAKNDNKDNKQTKTVDGLSLGTQIELKRSQLESFIDKVEQKNPNTDIYYRFVGNPVNDMSTSFESDIFMEEFLEQLQYKHEESQEVKRERFEREEELKAERDEDYEPEDYEPEEFDAEEAIEDELRRLGYSDVYDAINVDGKIEIRAKGVNANSRWPPTGGTPDSLDYMVVFEGENFGQNIAGDGDIVKPEKILYTVKVNNV